jgi:hypothetical protein
MRATEKTYTRVGLLGLGGFMFIASTIWDLYRSTSSPPRTTSYALDVILNLLIWPLAGYLAGLVCWKLVGESDFERPTNQRDEQGWTHGDRKQMKKRAEKKGPTSAVGPSRLDTNFLGPEVYTKGDKMQDCGTYRIIL